MRRFLYLTCLFYFFLPSVTSVQNLGGQEGGNWYGVGCPPHATGQFPYSGDCKRFYNCYKGRGQLSVCAPGTLFNPVSLECDFPSKVVCLKGSQRGPETSRYSDDPYHHRPHHHHHQPHNFQHSSEYHSQDSRVRTPSDERRAEQQRSWGQGYQPPPGPLHPHYPGHYIYDTKDIKSVGGPHGGVQPPRSQVPSEPARELLPPVAPAAPAEATVYGPPSQGSLYSPDYGRGQSTAPIWGQAYPSSLSPSSGPTSSGQGLPEPSHPRAHSYPTLPSSVPSDYEPQASSPPRSQTYPSGDYDRQFDSVVPRPVLSYNPYGPQAAGGGGYSPGRPSSSGYGGAPPPSSPGWYQPPPAGRQPPPRWEQQPSVVTATPPLGSDYPSSFPGPGSGLELPRSTTSTERPSSSGRGGSTDACPKGFSGLMPHTDCTKFLSCSHGRTFVMSCGPGTRFHRELLVCDHAHMVSCSSGEPNSEDVDIIDPPQSLYPSPPPQDFHTADRGRPLTSRDTDESDSRPVEDEIVAESEQVTSSYRPSVVSRPALSISVSGGGGPSSAAPSSSPAEGGGSGGGERQSFRPPPPGSSRGRLISRRNATAERQTLRLRGSPSQSEGFVEMQLAPGSWGLLCDRSASWKSVEAHVVCRTLGFPRGAELTWQGLPAEVSDVTSELLAADEVTCTGSEESILDCALSVGSGCRPERDGIWVRCYGHGQSRCGPGELSLGEHCYSLVVPDEDTPTEQLVGFTQGEALRHCQSKGGRLLDVTSQVENDFVSEWLIRQNVHGNIMTSGVGTLLMGIPVWIWEGSDLTFSYHNWWPGWEGVKSVAPRLSSGGAHCIVLRRHFPCAGRNSTVRGSSGLTLPGTTPEREEELCDTQYYFWDVEDCSGMSTSQPYVCKRPANNIGCVTGTGASYKGAANLTKSGKHCLNWDNKEVLGELKYKISESDRKMSLSGHNYCRNIAGSETHPWCYVNDGKSIKKELCEIPICTKAVEKSARYFECPPNHYSCGVNGECIPSSKVCDGHYDCSNANDESGCGKPQNLDVPGAQVTLLSQFALYVEMKLTEMELELIVGTPLSLCAEKCLERVNCRSFSYFGDEEQCLLSESNIGLSGALHSALGWNYYELNSKSINCQSSHTCKNGKCIANETVCNGRNDCGDNSDESDCSWLKQKIQIRLTGGSKSSEGAVEVKALDRWGLVCDDEFDLKDGDVVCRHLGFPLGALEVKKHGHFKSNRTTSFLIDNLNCTGDESSLADCHHNGWGIHDCDFEEAAGVVCREKTTTECNFNYWQCATSAECIPLGFLCDSVRDCADGSDEQPDHCQSKVEVRLVGVSRGGGQTREGRVEVKRFGVWGTVCDDDFTEREAAVVCRSLGFTGTTAQAYKEAAYGAGKGIIWLDQVHCLGNETNLAECMADPWGQTNCRHNEDVAVACSSGASFNLSPKAISKQVQDSPDQDIDDSFLDNLFSEDCGTLGEDLDIASSDFRSQRVVSGFETVKGAYPWQTSIRVKSASGKSSHWCGAAVISKYHILTAGHCVRDYIKAAYFVRLGDYDTEVTEGTEQDFEIDEIWIHPDLDKTVRLNNDIALVKVKSPGVEFNRWIRPACLPSRRDLGLPTNCTISGWGSTASPGTGFARTLHATWLSPLPAKDCRSPLIYGDSLREGMFCAGRLEGGPDSCQGDSGGPLLCPLRGKMTLFGVTSWGHGCGRANSPGVYTKVSHYLDWIHDKIKTSMKNHKQRPNSKRMLHD